MSNNNLPSASPLLREWSRNHINNNNQEDQDNNNVEVPVAPAVVVVEQGDDDDNDADGALNTLSGSPYSYPVATFVRDMVRTSLEHMHMYAAASIPADDNNNSRNSNINSDESSRALIPEISVRSAPTPRSNNNMASSDSSIPLGVAAPSARSLDRGDMDFDEQQEFVLIDGDLIALPPPPPNSTEQEDIEDHVLRHKSRKLKGLRKLFKKKKSSKKQEEVGVQEQDDKKKSKRRRSWKKQQHQELQQQFQQQHRQEDVATSASSAAAIHHQQQQQQQHHDPHQARRQPLFPPMQPISESEATSSAVSADFLGTADQLDGLASASDVILQADAYIEDDRDLKVDNLLTQARRETELERGESIFGDSSTLGGSSLLPDEGHSQKARAPKLEDHRCPLSLVGSLDTTLRDDDEIYNDTLKVFMVGPAQEKSALARALKNNKGAIATPPRSSRSARRPRSTLCVDVYPWHASSDLNVVIWDVQGASTLDSTLANAGAHSSTQSLFYSDSSLYILCWDLAASRVSPMRQRHRFTTTESMDYDDDDEEDDFLMELANKQTDRSIEADIDENVLSWLDSIPVSSAVLPVVMMPQDNHHDLDQFEMDRRCDIMQMLILKYFANRNRRGACPQLVFGTKDESIIRVDVAKGVRQLQKTILSMTKCKEGKHHIFPHVGTRVSPKAVEVLQTIHRLKKDHKVILIDHLLAEMNTSENELEQVTEALHFLSSIGELLYFGIPEDEVLSRYIILSRRWLVSALSCILRNDLKRELTETRRFMNLQCAYSGQAYSENDVAQTLLSSHSSSCPLLSSADSKMLWQSMSFMREASDRTAQLSEASSTMFDFLERLLVQKGVFLPLQVSQSIDEDEPVTAYFVPSLLAHSESADVWTFKSSDSWMTTLCHSWVLGDGATYGLMENVTVALLQDIYEFAQHFVGSPHQLERSTSFPMGFSSVTDFTETHDDEAIGCIKIHQVMTWKSSVLMKIGCVFCQADTREIRESTTEIFVSLVDAQSPLCVSADFMGSGMKQLVVSAKGQIGNHGQKIWNGGYRLALDSIKASLAEVSNVERQVVCPECLAHSHPNVASTWSWQDIRKMEEPTTRCMRGHVVDQYLLCGKKGPATPHPSVHSSPTPRVTKPVSDLLQSIALVGLWDSQTNQIRSVGSGFVVDRKLGLVVTAGHILFDMKEGVGFGAPYFGLKNAKAVIGIIPDDSHSAVFRYFAEIVAHDINNIDACVLRITTRMENDVEGEGEGCADQEEIPLLDEPDALKNEKLQHLKMTRRFELEEAVRILGFNQGGEGVLEEGKHVNRSADFAKGYVCKKFKANNNMDDSASEASASSSSTCFNPREEIVVMCPTISGHSGGPCVNDEGRVIGILSRADPVDRQRCYLVPASEIKDLVSMAKDKSLDSAGSGKSKSI